MIVIISCDSLCMCKPAELNVRINILLFAVHANEYAHRLDSNLNTNYYTFHYRTVFLVLIEDRTTALNRKVSIDSITTLAIIIIAATNYR